MSALKAFVKLDIDDRWTNVEAYKEVVQEAADKLGMPCVFKCSWLTVTAYPNVSQEDVK